MKLPSFTFSARRRLALLRFAGCAAGAAAACAAEKAWDVTVVGDVTSAGREFAPPSPAHPAYYVPVVIGFLEEGEKHAGEAPPPPKNAILADLARALAAQGYRSVGAKTPEPTLLLTFSWGAINPVFAYDQVEMPPTNTGLPLTMDKDTGQSPAADPGLPASTVELKSVANAPVMAALVAGNATEKLSTSVPSYMTDVDRDAAHEAISDDRYFVSVVAFDWQAVRAHKKVILWSTKMSVRSNHVTLAEVVPALIKSGAPFFGRETERPARLSVPAVHEGKVEVGTPGVVPGSEAPEAGRR